MPANHAIVSVGRYAVTLPTCPNWSQSLSYDFTNAFTSNYGCANATNLGLMVASPGDLVSGRPFSGADAQPAAAAVQRYLTDRVKQPPAMTASPFAAATGGDSGGSTPAGAPGTGRNHTSRSAPLLGEAQRDQRLCDVVEHLLQAAWGRGLVEAAVCCAILQSCVARAAAA